MDSKTTVKLIPLLFGFFVMGFADIIGISVTYAKAQFDWTETQAGFLPTMLFFWFLILSIPTAIFMNKIGRKNIVLISMIVTFIGMVIPFVRFTPVTCYVAFAMLGIGNTFMQVSLNPLLSNIVQGKMLTSTLTAGQLIKALSAFMGPLLSGFFSLKFGTWEILFPVYAVISLISFIWLYFTQINKEVVQEQVASTGPSLQLLKKKKIILLFLGILCIVGLDVGMNIGTPKILMERVGLNKEVAGYGTSWYFGARSLGSFLGMFLLARVSEIKYYRINIIIAILAVAGLLFADSYFSIIALVVIIASTCSCVFSILFSIALQTEPQKNNEISGLLLTGVAGGAISPPLMAKCTDLIGSQTGSVIIIAICALYLCFCGFMIKKHQV